MGAQGKRHNVWMPRLGTCVARTAHTLTLSACCMLHSFHIPFISVLTYAEQGKSTPGNPKNAMVTTLAF